MANRTTLRRAIGLSLIGICLWGGTGAEAATQYISDQLSINMRSGPGTKYKIKTLLNAGEPLQTLSESNGWTKIRTEDGRVGFVLTRFISEQPAARDRVSSLSSQVEDLKSRNMDLKQELSEALQGSDELGELKRDLVAENKSLKSRLQTIRETSADAIRISNENEKYRKQLMSLRSRVDRLKHENQALQSRREGMKVGALILFGGILVGLVLPMLRRRRKGSWDSL